MKNGKKKNEIIRKESSVQLHKISRRHEINVIWRSSKNGRTSKLGLNLMRSGSH